MHNYTHTNDIFHVEISTHIKTCQTNINLCEQVYTTNLKLYEEQCGGLKLFSQLKRHAKPTLMSTNTLKYSSLTFLSN